jgi:hypothetical protein
VVVTLGGILEVSVEQSKSYQSFSCFYEFDPDDHSNYIDLSGNPNIKPDSELYNKRFLQLGSN